MKTKNLSIIFITLSLFVIAVIKPAARLPQPPKSGQKVKGGGLSPDEAFKLLNKGIKEKKLNFIESAIEDNADLSGTDESGKTPLMNAILSGNFPIVERLLRESKRLNIDAQDQDGNTALMHAGSMGRSDFIDILRQNRANESLRNNQGQNFNDLYLLSPAGEAFYKRRAIEQIKKHLPIDKARPVDTAQIVGEYITTQPEPEAPKKAATPVVAPPVAAEAPKVAAPAAEVKSPASTTRETKGEPTDEAKYAQRGEPAREPTAAELLAIVEAADEERAMLESLAAQQALTKESAGGFAIPAEEPKGITEGQIAINGAFLSLVAAADIEGAKQALEGGADIKAIQEGTGNTALMLGIIARKDSPDEALAMIKFLVNKLNDDYNSDPTNAVGLVLVFPEEANNEGNTAAHIAALNNDQEALNALRDIAFEGGTIHGKRNNAGKTYGEIFIENKALAEYQNTINNLKDEKAKNNFKDYLRSQLKVLEESEQPNVLANIKKYQDKSNELSDIIDKLQFSETISTSEPVDENTEIKANIIAKLEADRAQYSQQLIDIGFEDPELAERIRGNEELLASLEKPKEKEKSKDARNFKNSSLSQIFGLSKVVLESLSKEQLQDLSNIVVNAFSASQRALDDTNGRINAIKRFLNEQAKG